jgi:hypothetical protein
MRLVPALRFPRTGQAWVGEGSPSMLKWIVGGFAIVVIAAAAVIFSPEFLWINRELVDDETRQFCQLFFKNSAVVDEVTTKPQYDATCRCFADDVLRELGKTDVDNINDAALIKEVEPISERSIQKCVKKAGVK